MTDEEPVKLHKVVGTYKRVDSNAGRWKSAFGWLLFCAALLVVAWWISALVEDSWIRAEQHEAEMEESRLKLEALNKEIAENERERANKFKCEPICFPAWVQFTRGVLCYCTDDRTCPMDGIGKCNKAPNRDDLDAFEDPHRVRFNHSHYPFEDDEEEDD